MRYRPIAFLLCLLSLGGLAACQNKPVHLYVLTAIAEQKQPVKGRGVALGIGPVTLPKYLDRPQIVSRIAPNSLDQAEMEQWGGDLNDNIVRVLATNLGNLLGTDRISIYPGKGIGPIDYQISMDIVRFDQNPDGSVVLDVFWSIASPRTYKVLVMKRSTYSERAGGIVGGGRAAYDAMIAAMNRDLLALSRDIGAAISQLGKH